MPPQESETSDGDRCGGNGSGAGGNGCFDEIRALKLLGPRDLASRHRGTDCLLIDRQTPNWIRTNEVGERIVALCDGTRTVAQITDLLAGDYDLPCALVETEIAPFVIDAVRNGFLCVAGRERTVDAPPPACRERRVENLWLHVTRRCNLACTYCYYDAGRHNPDDQDLRIEEIAEILSEVPWARTSRIMITGGEPMLRDDIEPIAQLCKATDAAVCLLTNGTIKADLLCERMTALADTIQISLDAASAEVHDRLRGAGSFARSVATIERLRDLGYGGIVIAFTPTSENLGELPKMAKLARRLGASTLHVNRFVEQGRAGGGTRIRPDADEYERQVAMLYKNYKGDLGWVRGTRSEKDRALALDVSGEQLMKIATTTRRTGCGLGCTTISIASDGGIYPCPALHVEELSPGNVRSAGFAELHQRSIDRFGGIGVDSMERCKQCDFRYFCGGGCRAPAFLATAVLDSSDPNCDRILALMETRCWQLDPDSLRRKAAQDGK